MIAMRLVAAVVPCMLTVALCASPAGAVDLAGSSVEVTQAIQKTDNSIRLVAGRSTAVRATLVNNDGGAVTGVTGRLHVFRDGIEITPPAGLAAINQPFTAPTTPQRANENDTLNFELTGAGAAGLTASGNVDFQVDVDPVPGEIVIANNSGSALNLTVAAHTTPSIFYTRINYTPVGPPDDSLIQAPVGDAFVRGIWPVNDNDPNLYRQGLFPSLTYSQDDGDGIIEFPATSEGTDLIALLSSCRQLIVDNGLGPTQTTFLYGWLAGNPTNHNGLSNAGKIGYGNTDPVRFQRTFAHELGHMIGHAVDDAPPIDEVGWDVGARLPDNPATNNVIGRVKPTTLFDIMEAGLVSTQAWISTGRYLGGTTDSDLGNGPDASPDQVRKRLLRRVLVVQGTFSRGGRLLELEPVFRYPWLSEPSARNRQGRYVLIVQPQRGQTLSFPFDAFNFDDRGERSKARGFFEVMVPLSTQVRSIAILDRTTGRIIAERARSSRTPKIQIVSPRPDAQLGEQTTIRWQATDPDTPGRRLQYQIAYSPDGGNSFVPLGVDLSGTSFTFDSTQIQRSQGQGLIRVFVSDGLNTSFADVAGLTPTAAQF